jgi:hypothetical protein
LPAEVARKNYFSSVHSSPMSRAVEYDRMKTDDVSNEAPQTGLLAAHVFRRERGISDTTLWRWSKAGWIKTVKVGGRLFIDLASFAELSRRAERGELANPPAGAAAASWRNKTA